jgi:hypothetical protein
MLKVFLIFWFLQLADLGTTVAVFRLGGGEQNPLVHYLMAVGPVEGVILAKIVALAIGVGCVMAAKHRPLRVANLFFAGVVAWNLSIIARLA